MSSVINLIFIVLVLCIDSFVLSIAYGSNDIKIPLGTTLIMSLIGSVFLAISLFAGNFISQIVPINIVYNITFVILFIMGAIKFFESLIKFFIRREGSSNKRINFKISNINFSLDIIFDENVVKRSILTFNEAICLGVALSIDSLAIGLGISFMDINYLKLIIFSFLMSVFFMNVGYYIGKIIAMKKNFELNWLNGAILMGMAISKIIKL